MLMYCTVSRVCAASLPGIIFQQPACLLLSLGSQAWTTKYVYVVQHYKHFYRPEEKLSQNLNIYVESENLN